MDTQLRVSDSDNLETEAPVEPARRDYPASRPTLPKLIQWIPIIFAILMAGNFYYQWRYAEDFPEMPFAWKAHWITSPYKNDSIACFRKTFYLPDRVTHATLFFAANDMFTLTVNGNTAVAGAAGEKWNNMPKLQTPYSEMSYYRRDFDGNTYNLTPNLHRGKNLICVQMLAMQGDPRMAAQLEVDTSTHQEILSDGSWVVAPHDVSHGSVFWTSPNYHAYDWPPAVVESGPVQTPFDVDPEAVETPFAGILLSAPSIDRTHTVAFRKTIYCSARSLSSYLRVATTSPYDLYINGLFVVSTSLTSQYQQSVLTHNESGQSSGVYDAFESIQQTDVSEYNTTVRKPQINVLMLRNLFMKGPNKILLVIHPGLLDPVPQESTDGLVREEDGKEILISASNRWQTSTDNGTTWQTPVITAFPEEKYAGIVAEYYHGKIDPGYTTYLHMARNDAIGFVVCLLIVGLGNFWIRRNPLAAMRWTLPSPLAMLSLIALPTSLLLFLSMVAQTIYRGSPQWDAFDSPLYAYWTLVISGIVALLALVTILMHHRMASAEVRKQEAAPVPVPVKATASEETRQSSSALQFAYKYGYAIAMVLVAGIVGAFAFYNLGAADLLPDEYTTLMAARGILMHGMPIYPMTGVIYSRSAVYHYLLAGCMAIAHSTTNPFADRFLSAFWHVCTTILCYFIGREMKSRNVGVVSALVVGLSPFMLYYAREARFYAQFVFFATVFFYLLYRALRNPDNPKLRMYACLGYIGAYASQEFAVTLLPAWALLVVLSGQTRLWLQWRTVRWIALAFAGMGLEFYLYTKYCVTPLLNVDEETILLMSFHADNLDQIPSMLFSGNERSDLVLGILYFTGLFALLFRPLFQHKAADAPAENELVERRFLQWRWWNYCYIYVTVGVTLTTMLTPHPANRYVCHMFPPLAICAVCVAFTIGEWLYAKIKELSGAPITGRFAQGLFLAATLGLCVLAQRPDRVWNNIYYSRVLNRGTTLATNYVHQHIKPGDKTLFFATDLGTIVLNQADYFWRPPANSVFVTYRTDGPLTGKLVERDSGAIMIDNVDKLKAAMNSCKRLWIICPQPTMLQGPSANGKMAEFANANFTIEYESAGMDVMLYDKARNHYHDNEANQPNDMYYF